LIHFYKRSENLCKRSEGAKERDSIQDEL